jgi:undecaprenyl pyrophosphate phosphatase UppP
VTYLQAVVIALIQGVTELFPVSSLGHSVLVPAWIGGSWQTLVTQSSEQSSDSSFYLAYIVALHCATALALMWFFRADWVRLIRGFFRSLPASVRLTLQDRRLRLAVADKDERLAWMIIFATIPVGLTGVVLEHTFRVVFAKPTAAAVLLFINGLILLGAEALRRSAIRRKRAGAAATTPGRPAQAFASASAARATADGAPWEAAASGYPGYGRSAGPGYGRPADPGYGGPADPRYGRSADPGYGRSADPGYGRSADPGYGRSADPGYGRSADPGYGRPADPRYGPPEDPGYGRPEDPGYGRPADPRYGRPADPRYGGPADPGYGRSADPRYRRSADPRYGRPADPGYGRSADPRYDRPADPGYGRPADPRYSLRANPGYEGQPDRADTGRLASHRKSSGGRATDDVDAAERSDARLARLSYKDGILIGATQILALLAGISRSGITMAGGLWRGLDHEDAARFAFLLATPVILAAGVLKVPSLLGPAGAHIHGQVVLGVIVCGISAYLSVRFLVRWFQTRTLTPFAIYCLVFGALSVLRFL